MALRECLSWVGPIKLMNGHNLHSPAWAKLSVKQNFDGSICPHCKVMNVRTLRWTQILLNRFCWEIPPLPLQSHEGRSGNRRCTLGKLTSAQCPHSPHPPELASLPVTFAWTSLINCIVLCYSLNGIMVKMEQYNSLLICTWLRFSLGVG